MTDWFARPVLHVSSVEASLRLMFISLNVEPQTHEAAVAALDALRAELEARGVSVKDGRPNEPQQTSTDAPPRVK